MTAEQQRVRNAGSNFTTFRYQGTSIAFLEAVNDTGQRPLGAGYEFIQPLGSIHPVDIVTVRALGGGVLTLNVREIWHQEVWEQLADLTGTTDIVEVFNRLAARQTYVTCSKIITPPDGRRYGKTYHRCTIVGVPDGESFDLATLSQNKQIQIAYTHTTPL